MKAQCGLVLQNIAKNIGPHRILRDVSLDVRPGEFLALVGPSGCGKSTLLRIIAGLDRQTTGEVWIGTKCVDDVRPMHRDVSMVFQSYALYPHMTVRSNIAVPLRMRNMNRWQRLPLVRAALPIARRKEKAIAEKVSGIARSLQIEHLLARKPGQLSGGQRQRVALARAMVREPAIFLMDEPLSNLDAAMRVQARTEIAQLHRRLETTLVYVTHDQTEAMTMSDRVAVMLEGELLQVDTPEAIYATPADIRVAEFVGTPRINILGGHIHPDGRIVIPGLVLPLKTALPSGNKVSVGVRPEALKISTDGISARVAHIENLGSDVLVHATLEQNSQTIIVRIDPYQVPTPSLGAAIFLMPVMERALVFDETGQRIPMEMLSCGFH